MSRIVSLDSLNQASVAEFVAQLEGIYEHSPWIAERAAGTRPHRSQAQLQQHLAAVVRMASEAEQLGLIRAHPELAGKAMVAKTLTAESSQEQRTAGLTNCSPAEFERLLALNAAYNARFGFPFILAVRGPQGSGLSRSEIIATFERRLGEPVDVERAECLRQIHRIAELRLDDLCGEAAPEGSALLARADALARHSEPGYAEQGQLCATYLTPAHRECARQLAEWMREDGFDEVSLDAVGNVVGVYHAASASVSPAAPDPEASPAFANSPALPSARSAPAAPRLLTGSHYDTVRNAGRFDGRLGILVAMAAVRRLHAARRRLPFAIELVAFAEEEGQRFPATFLASSALVGRFKPEWLAQTDAEGTTLRAAMQSAGLPGDIAAIHALARDPAAYLGFVEVHIEQGPVLNALDLPLGVVSAINGSRRFQGEVQGQASHAGTTPMGQRRDAAVAVAEFALAVERRAGRQPAAGTLVATIGQLEVPQGSVNVVPGRCRFSLDVRASDDATRDACVADLLAELGAVCERRGLQWRCEETMRAAAAPSDPVWQARWARAVEALGLPAFELPSGAGHDAMKMHEALPQAMLFVRGQNGGISHNPLESVTHHDAELALRAFSTLLDHLAEEIQADPSAPTSAALPASPMQPSPEPSP